MTPTDPQPPSAQRQHRPGRLRRWLVRPVVWILVLLVVLAAVAWWGLQTPWAKERARAELVRRLSEALETEVTVERLDFSLVPLAVTAEGVAVADIDPTYPPLFEADRVQVGGSVVRGPRWQIHLRSLVAEGPVLRLRRLPDGSWNLPRPEREAAAESRFEVYIGSLDLRHGLFVLEDRELPLDLAARDVSGRLLGDGPDAARGDVEAQEVELRLPQGKPYLGRVSGRVRVARAGLELYRARVEGPYLDARVQGQVRWEDGEQRASFAVEADGDGRLLDALGYVEEQVRGRFDARVQVLWEPDLWGVRGNVTSPELSLFDWPLTAVTSTVAVDENAARVDITEAGFGGGRVEGEVHVDLKGEARPTDLTLAVRDVDLEALVQGLGLPVENVFGRVGGSAEYHFALDRPEAGDGRADLQVEAVAGSGPGVPLHGLVPVAIRDGVVRVGELALASDTQRLTGDGVFRLAEGTGRFDLEVGSDRLGELRHLLPFDTETEPPLWLPRRGNGELTARVDIAPARVGAEIGLLLRDVVAPGLAAESVRGNLTVGESGVERMDLEARRPEAMLVVRGSVPFEEGVAGAPPLDIELEAARWPVADADPWLPAPLPLDGRFSGDLRLTGGLEAVEGHLAGRVDEVAAGPVRSGTLELDLAFDPRRVQLRNALWTTPAGAVEATGTYEPESGSLDFRVASEPLALAREPLSTLGASGLQGHVRLDARLLGTVEDPRLDLTLAAADLRLAGGAALPPSESRLRWQGGELEVTAELPGLLTVRGGGALTWETADLRLELEGHELRRLLQIGGVELPQEVAGGFGGELLVRRAAADPALHAELILDRLEARYAGHRLYALEPVRARLEGGEIHLDSLYLGTDQEGLDLFVGGSIGAADPFPLDLHLQTSLPVTWLELVAPELDVAGRLDLLATVRGTATAPRFNGQGELREGRMLLAGFPHSFEQIAGVVLLYPDRAVIDHLNARFAGGDVRVAGTVRPEQTHPLGWSYELQIEGDGLRLRYPAEWRLVGDAQLMLASTPHGRQLTGVVNLERAFYLADVEVGPIQLLQDFLRRNPQRLAETDETLRSTQLQVQVVGPDALRVRNNLADVTGDIELVIRGSAARPVPFGQVTVDPDSTLSYGGNEYRVERGTLVFANPYRIDPYVDLVAETEIQQYLIRLTLDGSLSRPNATFSSNPPLADLDVLALVTTGSPTTPGESLVGTGAGTGTEGSGAAEGFLYGQAAGLVSERVNRLFGLDKFRIDPLTTGSGELSQARVTVGEQISRDVLVTYSWDPSTTQQQILQVEWRISPQLSLLLTQNGDDTYSVDAQWEKRF